LPEAEKRLRELLHTEGIETKPWAHFRILTNLGSVALYLGREAEAISYYEAAYALRPSDSKAKANLALVCMRQGRLQEAMTLAQEALSNTPRADHAISYLLQAAAYSDWEGEPESLIPDDLAGTDHADIGLAEFYRRREMPGWQARCVELAHRHPDTPEFVPINAIAVLSLAVESGGTIQGGLGPVTAADLTRAADEMKAFAERMLESGFADEHDRHAHLNNASVLLRLCGRYSEIEALLRRGGRSVADDAVLRIQMALALAFLDRQAEAIEWLVHLAGTGDSVGPIMVHPTESHLRQPAKK
jgi:tetratricopeptide (TPR) repeat protein